MLSAAVEFLPDQAGADILAVDIVDGPEPEIWITETTLGGGGAIEAIGAGFAEDPWRFARAFEAALALSDTEIVVGALRRTVSVLSGSSEAQAAAAAVRQAGSHAERSAAQVALNRQLARHGIPVDRSVAVALSQRLMRPGADASFDALIAETDEWRNDLEARLGFALDLRLMTLVLGEVPSLKSKLMSVLSRLRGEQPSAPQLAATMAGVLWPSPAEVRRHVLEVYSPFGGAAHPDPRPLRNLIASSVPRVRVGCPGAEDAATAALGSQGVVELIEETGDALALITAVQGLLTLPVTLDFLRLHPSIAGIRGEGDAIVARLEVRELA